MISVFCHARGRSAPRGRALVAALLAALTLATTGCRKRAVALQGPTEAPMPKGGACEAPACVGVMDAAALAAHVTPLVVNITTTERVRGGPEGFDPFEFFFGPRRGGPDRPMPQRVGLGSGFIIDKSGYVVTNEHVIHDASDVVVRLADDREFTAKVIGRDAKLDLALLALQGARDLPAAALGSSDALKVGEPVLAVGNPFGLGNTVTTGIVSAKERAIGVGPYDDFIQTDASINPGNSGGPLFNARGEVVGINAVIRAGANGIGFAIPIDALKQVLPQLLEKGYVERGKLGVAIRAVTPDIAKALKIDRGRGALVAQVEPNGAAAQAGIEAGDLVVAVNDTPIRHAEELPRTVARYAPGTKVVVHILRGGQERTVTATLGKLESDEGQPSPGGGPGTPPGWPK